MPKIRGESPSRGPAALKKTKTKAQPKPGGTLKKKSGQKLGQNKTKTKKKPLVSIIEIIHTKAQEQLFY